MGQKLKQFTEYFRNASLEIRTYYLVAAVGSVFSFFTMTTNIILGFGWLTVVLPLAIGLITILITYWGAKTGNFYRSAIIILTLLCVVVYPGLWLVSGGSKGTIPLFFLVSLFFIPLLLNKRDSLILFILNIIAVVGLLVLENAMPQIIQQYSSDFIRIVDMIFVMLLLLTSAFFLAMVLKLEYQRKIDSLNVLTKEYEKLSATDELTDLYNRRFIKNEIVKSLNHKESIILIMVDVDDFKNINDTYGHSVGDQVLISISHTLKSKLKKGEIIGRLGGEEFLLLLKDSNLKSASKLAEELRKEIERFNIDTINKPITISLGIYQTQDGDSIDDVLVEVDKCLYKAKNLGKNIVYNTEKKD